MDNNTKKISSIRRLKLGSYGIVLTAVVIALVVFINLFVSALPTTLTHFSTESVDYYSTGEETAKIVSAIDTDVTAYLVAEKGNEDGRVRELLSRYEALTDKLTVKTVDPAEDLAFVEKYKDEGLTSNSVVFVSEKRFKVVLNSDIYRTEYTEEEMYYIAMGYQMQGTGYFDGELAITSALDFVTRDELPIIYTLTGHGESALDSTYLEYIEEENLSTAELNLLSSDIPEDCAALLIAAPTSDITEEELEKVSAYMKNGGKVVLITVLNGFSDEKTPNLASLAGLAGMEGDPGVVMENNQQMYYGYQYMLMPEIVASSGGITSLLGSTNINTIINVAHGISKVEGSDTEVTPIIRTSENAVLMDVSDEGQIVEREDESSNGPIMVGAHAKLSGENGDGELVWYSSASLIDSSFESGGITGNRQIFIATLNHLCGGETSVSIIGKSMNIDALVIPQGSSTVWMIVMIAAVPLMILGVGFAVWLRRRRR